MNVNGNSDFHLKSSQILITLSHFPSSPSLFLSLRNHSFPPLSAQEEIHRPQGGRCCKCPPQNTSTECTPHSLPSFCSFVAMQLILKEGVNSLEFQELQTACQARGMRTLGISTKRMRSELQQWIGTVTSCICSAKYLQFLQFVHHLLFSPSF